MINIIDTIEQETFEQEIASTYALLNHLEKEYEIYCYYESHHLIMEEEQSQQDPNQSDQNKDNSNIFVRIWNGIVNLFKLIGKAIKAFWMVLTKKTPGEKFMVDMYKRMDQKQLEHTKELLQQEIQKQQNQSIQEGALIDVAQTAVDGYAGQGDIKDVVKHTRQLQKDMKAGYTPSQIIQKNAPEIAKTATSATFGGWFGGLVGTKVAIATGAALTATLGVATGGIAAGVIGVIAGGIVDEISSGMLLKLANKIVPPSESKSYYNLPKLEQCIAGGDDLLKESVFLRTIVFESNQHTPQEMDVIKKQFTKQIALDPTGEGTLQRLKNWTEYVKKNSAFQGDGSHVDQSVLNDEKNLKIYADCLTFDIDASTPTNDRKFNEMMSNLQKEYDRMNGMINAANMVLRRNMTTFSYDGKEYVIDQTATSIATKGGKNVKENATSKLLGFGKQCLEYMQCLKFVQDIGRFWSSLYGTIAERLQHRDQMQHRLQLNQT